jgi:hypothetical protein
MSGVFFGFGFSGEVPSQTPSSELNLGKIKKSTLSSLTKVW